MNDEPARKTELSETDFESLSRAVTAGLLPAAVLDNVTRRSPKAPRERADGQATEIEVIKAGIASGQMPPNSLDAYLNGPAPSAHLAGQALNSWKEISERLLRREPNVETTKPAASPQPNAQDRWPELSSTKR